MAMNEKSFECFSDFFPEIRQCIVDEMEPTERVRFTRCSKRSAKEAKRSKNYIYGLEIESYSENFFRITVKHGKIYEYPDYVGFVMKFREENGEKCKICANSYNSEEWREKLDDSADMFQLAGDYMKLLLQTYRSTIKHVAFEGDKVKDFDFEIGNLKSLTSLDFDGPMNIAQYLFQLTRPLYSLQLRGQEDREFLANCEQVYQVKHFVITFNQTFTFEQMLRLSARVVRIDIGSLTAENISKIIRLWQNGRLIRDKVAYFWLVRDSSFAFEVLRLLGVPSEELQRLTFEVEIKHNNVVGKVAKLSYKNEHSENEFQFVTYIPCGKEECTCERD